MIECEKCRYTNSDSASRCISCGYLINIPINRHRTMGLLERMQNSRFISKDDWTSFLLQLLIPIYNVYLIIRLGFFTKEESSIKNFCRALVAIAVGWSVTSIVGEVIHNLQLGG